jgi:hypothetical protein
MLTSEIILLKDVSERRNFGIGWNLQNSRWYTKESFDKLIWSLPRPNGCSTDLRATKVSTPKLTRVCAFSSIKKDLTNLGYQLQKFTRWLHRSSTLCLSELVRIYAIFTFFPRAPVIHPPTSGNLKIWTYRTNYVHDSCWRFLKGVFKPIYSKGNVGHGQRHNITIPRWIRDEWSCLHRFKELDTGIKFGLKAHELTRLAMLSADWSEIDTAW